MKQNVFNTLLLLARPAAGKSEIIEFLGQLSLDERITKYHIGDFETIDDFPMLWNWFEEDTILERLGHSRLFTDQEGYFLYDYLWDLLIEKINLKFQKIQRNYSTKSIARTTIIEFSRGKEHGGFKRAFSHLSDEIINKAAILYVNVSWEESLRKNRKRFNPEKPDSILEHSLPDKKLAKMYYETDWNELSAQNCEFIKIGSNMVPYSIFENEDDVTSGKTQELEERLCVSLDKLWHHYLYKS